MPTRPARAPADGRASAETRGVARTPYSEWKSARALRARLQLFVKAIVSVARGLHKTTIAEGVEDDETLAMLKAFGVDCAQGYLFERPHAEHALLRTSSRIRTQFARSA